MRGGEELRGLSQWVQLYTGAQINFGDLTLYLTFLKTPIACQTATVSSLLFPLIDLQPSRSPNRCAPATSCRLHWRFYRAVVGKSDEIIAYCFSVTKIKVSLNESVISTDHWFLKHFVQCNRSLVFKSQQHLYFLPENLRFKNKMIDFAHHCYRGSVGVLSSTYVVTCR